MFIYLMLTGDKGVAERLALVSGSTVVGLFTIVGLIFLFINALVTFPYYWVQGICGWFNFFIRRKKVNWVSVKKWCVGTLLSITCIVVSIIISISTGVLYAT